MGRNEAESRRAGPVIIRPARTDDMPAVGRLGALLIRTHHGFDAARFLPETPQTAEGYASFLGSQLRKRDVQVLVGEVDDAVVGYAYAAVEGHDWMALRGPAGVLHDVIVHPDHRGRGIGRMLLAGVLRFLENRGSPRVVLSTAEANETAQRMFAGAGFRRTMVEMTLELGHDNK
jgi:ribosomal protein S18 acetylase RimI-like enzyme